MTSPAQPWTAIDPAADRLVPLEEAAHILGVERETLWYWRHRGEGPASFIVGRRKVVYRASVLAAYIAECEARSSVGRDARGDLA